jgi:hypothetical protein
MLPARDSAGCSYMIRGHCEAASRPKSVSTSVETRSRSFGAGFVPTFVETRNDLPRGFFNTLFAATLANESPLLINSDRRVPFEECYLRRINGVFVLQPVAFEEDIDLCRYGLQGFHGLLQRNPLRRSRRIPR